MRHGLMILILALLVPSLALAQSPPSEGSGVVVAPVTEPASPAPVPVPEVAPVPAPAPVPAVAPPVPPTTEELLAAGKVTAEQVVLAVRAERDAEGIQWVAWAGALAALFTLGLGLLRRFGGLLLNEQKLRVATLGLGLLAGLCGSLALGAPDWAAIVLGLSGPGSMLVYAVVDLFRPGSWAAAQAKADAKAGR